MRAIRVLTALLAAPFVVCGQNTANFEWRGGIRPGQTLEIRNINGSIRAEPAPGDEVEISVRIRGSRPAPESIRIHVEPHAGGILACTIYEGLSVPDYCTPEISPSVSLSNSDIVVEYTVKVPAGVELVAKTVNGRINAQLPESAIFAETVNGRILAATAREVSAKVVNGSILVSLDGVVFTRPLSFRAVNGSIDVELNPAARVAVRAGTLLGVLTTDFSVPVRRGWIGARAHGDINGGGECLTMETVNGSIHLRKQ